MAKRSDNKTSFAFTGYVQRILSTLRTVRIEQRGIRKYHGSSKVKLIEPWPPEGVPLVICDSECGEQSIVVRTKRRAAVARIIQKRLTEAQIPLIVSEPQEASYGYQKNGG